MLDFAQQYIGYNELHKLTGLCKGTLYALVSRKQIPHVRLSRRMVRFSVLEIQSWLDQHQVRVKTSKGTV